MRVGRIEFGITVGPSDWSFTRGSCKCRIIGIGRFYITLLDKDCKCAACNKFICTCEV